MIECEKNRSTAVGIFSKKIKSDGKTTKVGLDSFDIFSPTFSAFGKDYLKNETFQNCVRTNASYASKVKVKSVRELTDGGNVSDYKSLDFLLQYRPNPLMCASSFWERVSSFYDIYNNAFIYVERDKQNEIVALWSIDPSTARCMQSKTNKEWFIKFTLDGEEITAPYSQIIHISRNIINTEIWGDDNKSILQVLELINTNYQGLENAIKTSAVIRFIGQVSTKLEDKKLRKLAKRFTENYLKIKSDEPLGIALVDSMITNIKEVDTSKQKTANYMEQTGFDKKIHRFLSCPERICDGTATEDEIVAYIELRLEPFMRKVEQEMTAKIFTKKEFSFGNKIKASYNKIENMTMKTKLEFIKATRELGFITKGVYGDLLGIDVPKEIRDEVLTSQNYMQSQETQGGNDGESDGE